MVIYYKAVENSYVLLGREWKESHMAGSKAFDRMASTLRTVGRIKMGYCRDVPGIK